MEKIAKIKNKIAEYKDLLKDKTLSEETIDRMLIELDELLAEVNAEIINQLQTNSDSIGRM
jgi:hypothetical protein